MPLRRYVLPVLFFSAGIGIARAQTSFEKVYGGSLFDIGNEVQETTDGGYIAAGTTSSFGAGSDDMYLIRTNSSGDTIWTRTYGGLASEFGRSVHQTTDGGYIVAGSTGSYGAGLFDIYMVKTSSSGDTLWTRTFGGSSVDYGYSVQQTADGGYVVAGSSESFGGGSTNVYLVRTNSSGDTLWTRTYGESSEDYSFSVHQTTDGGFIVAGFTYFDSGSSDVYMIKTNSSGDTLWTRTYGGSSSDAGVSVQQTMDGGFIVAGNTSSFGAGSGDVYLIKTNSSGDTLWTRTYGGSSSDAGASVQQTTDGGFILAGSTLSFGNGVESDVYMIKTNSSGDTHWTRTYGGSSADHSSSVRQTMDGGYIVAGSTYSFADGSYNVYLIKTHVDGTLPVQGDRTDMPTGFALLQNYPNPFNPSTLIRYALPQRSHVRLELFNPLGQRVGVLVDDENDAGYHSVRVESNGLASGLYFYRLQARKSDARRLDSSSGQAGDFVETKKLIILR